jgi:predicted alpha/beta hydrolase family esterase
MAYEDVRSAPDALPPLLLLAGSNDPASERWLAGWETGFAGSRRVELGYWDAPDRSAWVNRVNLAVHATGQPVVLVAHGQACLAVAWWVEREGSRGAELVRGAVLHEPPVPARPEYDPQAAYPDIAMPFPTCLLASRHRGPAELAGLRRLARAWNCHFDTMAESAVPKPRLIRPIQSLGERFLANVMSARLGQMRPMTAQAGYPVPPRNG